MQQELVVEMVSNTHWAYQAAVDTDWLVRCLRRMLFSAVVASEKGVVVGRLSYREDGDLIDCQRMGVGGKAIPPNVDKACCSLLSLTLLTGATRAAGRASPALPSRFSLCCSSRRVVSSVSGSGILLLCISWGQSLATLLAQVSSTPLLYMGALCGF
jgi:hypothetical protein